MTDNNFDIEVGVYLQGVWGKQGKHDTEANGKRYTHYFFWDEGNRLGVDVCYSPDVLVDGRPMRILFPEWIRWNFEKDGSPVKDPYMKFTREKLKWAKNNGRVVSIRLKKGHL